MHKFWSEDEEYLHGASSGDNESDKSTKKKISPHSSVQMWNTYWNKELKIMMAEGIPQLVKTWKESIGSLDDSNLCKPKIKKFLELTARREFDPRDLIKKVISESERCYRYTVQLQNGFMCGLCNKVQRSKVSKFTQVISVDSEECQTFSRACVPRFNLLNKISRLIILAYDGSRCDATGKYKIAKKDPNAPGR